MSRVNRECNCDPFHCYCSDFAKLEQHWWTAWGMLWIVICIDSAFCNYAYDYGANGYGENARKYYPKGLIK